MLPRAQPIMQFTNKSMQMEQARPPQSWTPFSTAHLRVSYVDILGSATNTATVTVNNQATYRYGDYFRAELTADNTASAPWFGVTNVAVLSYGTNADIVVSTTGNVFVAQTPEAFTYDPTAM